MVRAWSHQKETPAQFQIPMRGNELMVRFLAPHPGAHSSFQIPMRGNEDTEVPRCLAKPAYAVSNPHEG